jgi:hypothetical protein
MIATEKPVEDAAAYVEAYKNWKEIIDKTI